MTAAPVAQGRRYALLPLVGCLALLAAACATPVGAVRVEPDVVHRTLTGSVLSIGTPSIPTQNGGSDWPPTSTIAASPRRSRRRTEPTSISVQESSNCRVASCTFRSTVTI